MSRPLALASVLGLVAPCLALKADYLSQELVFRSQLADGWEARILMTRGQEEVAQELQPWASRQMARVPPAGKGYLFFDSDVGGFNNVRMKFQYIVDVARTSGRTLVLPPHEAIYLLDWGPKSYRNKSNPQWMTVHTVTDYADLWEIPDLQQKIDVISAQEFYKREQNNLNIPPAAEPDKQHNIHIDWSPWKQWLDDTAYIAWGTCDSVRRMAEVKPMAHSLLYVPEKVWEKSDGRSSFHKVKGEQRFLYCYSQMVHDLHYREHLFQLASGPVSELGPRGYFALHLRRNDFQYKQAPDSPDVVMKSLEDALPGETVYIASDEINEQWWSDLKKAMAAKGHQVRTFNDFIPELDRRGMIGKFSGLIEMIICAGARRFKGSTHSTFTEGIQLLREELRDSASWTSSSKWGGDDFVVSREVAFLQHVKVEE